MQANDIYNSVIKDIYWRVVAKAVKDYRGVGLGGYTLNHPEAKKRAQEAAFIFLNSEYCLCICEIIGVNRNTLLNRIESIKI